MFLDIFISDSGSWQQIHQSIFPQASQDSNTSCDWSKITTWFQNKMMLLGYITCMGTGTFILDENVRNARVPSLRFVRATSISISAGSAFSISCRFLLACSQVNKTIARVLRSRPWICSARQPWLNTQSQNSVNRRRKTKHTSESNKKIVIFADKPSSE